MTQPDDADYEYFETTAEVDQGDGVPPPGEGWEFVERLNFGSIRAVRWRRKRACALPRQRGA